MNKLESYPKDKYMHVPFIPLKVWGRKRVTKKINTLNDTQSVLKNVRVKK